MEMTDIVDEVEKATGLTRYALAKELNSMGIRVTNPTALKYSTTKGSQGVRLPLLAGLFVICEKHGVSAKKFMGWIVDEFLPKARK